MRTSSPQLRVELVPSSSWFNNVRSHVSPANWEKCKQYARAQTGSVCRICGGVGTRHPVEAHEIWAYDDEYRLVDDHLDTGLQTLVDIWPLCPPCHQVKHLGFTRSRNDPVAWARAITHLQRVNGWDDATVEKYVHLQFQIWEVRSTMRWELDLTFLSDKLGIREIIR